MAFLDIAGLGKSFGKTQILDGLDLQVEKGEFVVVFGPSGAGKTVLLRLIAGILQPEAGDIRIGGASILGQGPETRDVGMAFQNFALYPHLPAFENIASPLRARRTGEAEIRKRVREVAELLRIGHVLDHLPKQLSNGQKQRTALARSLVCSPSVLLLDDPLRNVDAKIRYEMRQELPRLLRAVGATVLYVTQDYKEAMALGDRVGVLLDGRFRQIDTPAGIYGKPQDTRIARLFGDPPINLIETSAQDGRISIAGTAFPAPAALPAGKPCLVGLRPEDVEVRFEPAEDAVPVDLEAVTPLNVRTVMLLRAADGTEILASRPEDQGDDLGRGRRRAWARPDLARALCFDRETGARLPAATV
ncbi:MAG: ABC transporter ATP-binding protein [Inquilinus limosus]|uniref:ABC transporter ATP-binding protein n=1 Tax=Inquilinus limosus TaxID=171674 RepID=A0A952FQE5_9PROT|nr:ABC transporter ATP-binding protein [Inquilinus limosus]